MKKLIVFLVLSLGLLAEEKHKNVYLEIEKETNGGYFLMLPCVETEENSDNVEEGFQFNNKLKIGYKN